MVEGKPRHGVLPPPTMSADDSPSPIPPADNALVDPALPGADFISHILTPGSSLHPTFLLIVDGAFALLTVVLLGMIALTYGTTGNVHFVILTVIDVGLWGSVKW